MTIEFIKEIDNGGRWYAVIPEWEGSKAELEMVSGADTLLDIINLNNWEDNKVILELFPDEDIKPDQKYDGHFTIIKEDDQIGGGWYIGRYQKIVVEEVWLCDVTKFVFGYMPKNIAYLIH